MFCRWIICLLTLSGNICEFNASFNICSISGYWACLCIWALSHGHLYIVDEEGCGKIIWTSCCFGKFDDNSRAWWKWKHGGEEWICSKWLSKDFKLFFASPVSIVSWIFGSSCSLKWIFLNICILCRCHCHSSCFHPS